jgi:hypothetical protein
MVMGHLCSTMVRMIVTTYPTEQAVNR